MIDKHRLAILGIGNPLCRDDGIGIRAVQEMQISGNYPDTDIIDGGTSPDLLSLLDENTERLIIVDALKGGGRPGDIYRLDIDESNISDESSASLHGLGVLDSLKMMRALDMNLPRVTLIGIEPSDTSNGLYLSPEIEALVPQVIKTIENEMVR